MQKQAKASPASGLLPRRLRPADARSRVKPSSQRTRGQRREDTHRVRAANATSAGQDGPLLYPGPLCGGEAGSTGRVAGVDTDVDSFSHGQDARSKSPAPTHGLAAHGWAASAKRGGLSLWLLSLWPHKEKVTRAPQAHESSSLRINHPEPRASPAGGLLQMLHAGTPGDFAGTGRSEPHDGGRRLSPPAPAPVGPAGVPRPKRSGSPRSG
jgi:hypothetical protein